MTRMIFIMVVVIAVVLLVNGYAVSVDEPNKGAAISETPSTLAKPKVKLDSVTIIDFYMRDGNTMSGKLLKDDATQFVVEEPFKSTIITKTYSKREVDTRTVRTRQMLEWQYYVRLAEYFSAKTWDFVNDPDEFIEAIRCYEKAKQSLQTGGAEAEKIADIDKAIKKVQDDRVVWTREVESRAKLKKLEYDAEAENRLKKLERIVAENNSKLSDSVKSIGKTAEELKNDYKAVSDLNKDLAKQLSNMQAQINDNRALINNLSARVDACCKNK